METPSSMTSPRWALLASVAGALGASLCCALPLPLVSLGIGGSWLASLTALGPYWPLFVTLAVDQMTGAACPITVHKALSHVAGVAQATVDMETHTATVTFDPAKTTAEALATAVTNAGYPAKVLKNGG